MMTQTLSSTTPSSAPPSRATSAIRLMRALGDLSRWIAMDDIQNPTLFCDRVCTALNADLACILDIEASDVTTIQWPLATVRCAVGSKAGDARGLRLRWRTPAGTGSVRSAPAEILSQLHLGTGLLYEIKATDGSLFVLGAFWRGSLALDENMEAFFATAGSIFRESRKSEKLLTDQRVTLQPSHALGPLIPLIDTSSSSDHSDHTDHTSPDQQTTPERALQKLRQRLNASEERFRTFIDLANEGIWRTNAVGRTEFANRRLADMLGLADEEIANLTIWDLLEPSGIKDFERNWNALKNGRSQQFDCAFRRRDGRLVWALISSSPIVNSRGRFAGSIHLLTDVTARREAEEELKRATRIADEANKAKSQFLANMSHEIRTPLGAVLGFAELLIEENPDESERLDCVKAIKRNGQLLLHLINDILDLSKIEAGRMEMAPAPFSLTDLVQELRSFFRAQACSKALDFSIEVDREIPDEIISDPTRVRQVLLNIVGNALKFTDQGSVHVRFSRSGDMLIARVTDTGHGIRAEDIDRLFTPFTQADNSITRKFGGTGLGLVLARNLARALGGDVRLIESQADRGSTFEVSFKIHFLSSTTHPRNAHCFPKDIMNTATAQPAKGVRLDHVEVLLVDDAPDNRILLQRMLGSTGARITTAENGRQAVNLALSGRFDVILMDIQMPVLDGYKATRLLRQQGYKGPIIALTAHAMKEEKELCLAAGCNDHVVKPVDRNILISAIQNGLRRDLTLGF